MYNAAWAVGLLAGPSLGGALFERMGFARLTTVWAPAVVVLTWIVWRRGSRESGRGVADGEAGRVV